MTTQDAIDRSRKALEDAQQDRLGRAIAQLPNELLPPDMLNEEDYYGYFYDCQTMRVTARRRDAVARAGEG